MSEPTFLRRPCKSSCYGSRQRSHPAGDWRSNSTRDHKTPGRRRGSVLIINFKDEEIPLPAVFDGKEDILTGEKVQGGEMLKKYDLRIVSVPRA